MQQAHFTLRGLPITLVCLSDATVAFVVQQPFPSIFEVAEEPSQPYMHWHKEYFILHSEGQPSITLDYSTTYPYKQMPALLAYLQLQGLAT